MARSGRHRRRVLARLAPLAIVLVAGGAVLAGSQANREASAVADAQRPALTSPARDPALAALYEERAGAPLWTTDDAPNLARIDLLRRALQSAETHGLDSGAYLTRLDASVRAAPADAEIRLSRLLLDYSRDLRTPVQGAVPYFVDDQLQADGSDLRAVFRARDDREFGHAMEQVQTLNPLYDSLRQAYLRSRDPVIGLNMERTRALPAQMGDRFILVDVASARLWTYENGVPTGEMKVVVGGVHQQTPAMAALIRFSVLQPYWNVPEDMARTRFAPSVLSLGPDTLLRQSIEVLSDWTPDAHVVDPADIDWKAVSDGRKSQRLRQRPGAANMMGAVKFMFPNALGIYLHDTPDRVAFRRGQRTLSAGCVRLEDAERLWRWLYGFAPQAVSTGEPEQAVSLPDPVPIYILYLTVRPGGQGSVARGGDPYGLDDGLRREVDRARRLIEAA